jgi:hypothetical protein
MEKKIKSFMDYFIEKYKIDTGTIECIRTCGWGGKAVLRVEYPGFHKDYRPVRLAKQYLLEVYGYCPENLNFSNGHYNRTGCSVLNVYDVDKSDFDKYRGLPVLQYSEYCKKENRGVLEFQIHNTEQCGLCYDRKLHEYFDDEADINKGKILKFFS